LSKIFYGSSALAFDKNTSVLQALLQAGINTPYSCESGNCQTCMLRSSTKSLPPTSQAGLNDELRQQGYFLPCVCYPGNDVHILDIEPLNPYQHVLLLETYQYNADIHRLRLSKPENFDYQAGQFINLRLPNNHTLVRSYSLCSSPTDDDFLEIQLRHKRNGKLSATLCEQLNIGDTVEIIGANGNCFYQSDRDQEMLLIGTNTGIAPLYGIVREALAQEHKGNINIYYGSRDHKGLYLLDVLQTLATEHDNVNISATLSGEEEEAIAASEHIEPGRANDLAAAEHTQLKNSDVYLCGNAGMVKAAQMQCFLAGAAMQRIFTDPFEHQDLRSKARD
jgi:ferredoxin-NADP reductase/ferredoxin